MIVFLVKGKNDTIFGIFADIEIAKKSVAFSNHKLGETTFKPAKNRPSETVCWCNGDVTAVICEYALIQTVEHL